MRSILATQASAPWGRTCLNPIWTDRGNGPAAAGFDELERHRDTGGAGAGALGDSLAKPALARKFHDNAVRSLPEERAAEIAARTLALPDAPSVEDLTALLTSAGER